jgi:hypothetical protein
MHRYNVKVRIGGSVMNEVRKDKISAAEVMILRKLHGDDSVIDIHELENDRSSHEQEREHLKRVYGVSRMTENRTRLNFTQMFGPDHVELPARLPEFARTKETPERTAKTRLKHNFDTAISEVELDSIAG